MIEQHVEAGEHKGEEGYLPNKNSMQQIYRSTIFD